MKIEITPDKLKAYLIIESKEELEGKCVDDIVNFAKSSGVAYVIKMVEIEKLIENPSEGKFLIAEGSPPVDGRDGYISFEFDMSRRTLIRNVKAGERIAVVYPPTSGVDGVAVTGEILKTRVGRKANQI
jgi:uncharacterized protein (DUF342 family)